MPDMVGHPAGDFTWIELAALDQHAAKRFYSELFGYSVVDYPMGPSGVYSMFQLGGKDAGAAYTMSEQERANMPPHWNLYIGVDNADEAAALAKSIGGTVFMEPFDVGDAGRMAVLHDPTGAFFNIWQPKNSPGLQVKNVPGALCWADLGTGDAEKAKTFYGKLFHWEFSGSEADPSSGYLHIKNAGAMIGGIRPEPGGQYPAWLLYFLVEDVDAAANKALALGGKALAPPFTAEKVGRLAILADPQGAVFAIFKPAAN